MSEQDIKNIIDKLGEKVSLLGEQNRQCIIRDNACKSLINSLEKIVSPDDWLELYNSTNDTFVRDLMLDWGANIFPEDFKDE